MQPHPGFSNYIQCYPIPNPKPDPYSPPFTPHKQIKACFIKGTFKTSLKDLIRVHLNMCDVLSNIITLLLPLPSKKIISIIIIIISLRRVHHMTSCQGNHFIGCTKKGL